MATLRQKALMEGSGQTTGFSRCAPPPPPPPPPPLKKISDYFWIAGFLA